MTTNVFHRRADEYREKAKVCRECGHSETADLLEQFADVLEDTFRAHQHEELTVAEAAALTGYTEDYLRDLVRRGEIPDLRPEGSKADIRIRRKDLPRKPPGKREEGDRSHPTSFAGKVRKDIESLHR